MLLEAFAPQWITYGASAIGTGDYLRNGRGQTGRLAHFRRVRVRDSRSRSPSHGQGVRSDAFMMDSVATKVGQEFRSPFYAADEQVVSRPALTTTASLFNLTRFPI